MWWRRSALYLCGMTARSRASKQAASYAIPPIRATRCQAVDLRRLDAVGEVTADDPLPVQVAQEHAQRAAQPDHRGPPEVAGAFGDEGAEQERRQVLEIVAADAPKVALEATQEMAVVPDRRVVQAAFLPQVGEEAGSLSAEWIRRMRPTVRGGVIRQSNREHLLDGIANVEPDLPAGCRICLTAAGLHPVGDEGVDICRQLVPPCRSPTRRECAEPDQDRHPPKHVAR